MIKRKTATTMVRKSLLVLASLLGLLTVQPVLGQDAAVASAVGTEEAAASVAIDSLGEQEQVDASTANLVKNQTASNEEEEEEVIDKALFDDDDDEEEDKNERGGKFGAKQILHNIYDSDDFDKYQVHKRMDGAESYMREVINLQAKYKKIRPLCRNRHSHCTIWAATGECNRNPNYMKFKCGPACWSCHEFLEFEGHLPPGMPDEAMEEEGPGSEFGVIQQLTPGRRNKDMDFKDVMEKLRETDKYMGTVVWADDSYEKVHDTCVNKDRKCTIWAVEGLCDSEEDDEWMTHNCAPACQRCHHLHYETRCGPMAVDPNEPVAWKPGDITVMFERIIATHGEKANVISRPELLPEHESEETAPYLVGPWIVSIDDFLTPEEAQGWIEIGTKLGYERSTTDGDEDEETGEVDAVVYEARTSTNAWCDDKCQEEPISKQIFKKLENLTGIPMVNSEQVQLLNYEKGQHYETHHDYLDYEENAISGPRILTVFMYLSDVEEGGETRFDHFGDKAMVKPKLGRVVLWPSVLDEDPFVIDDRTEHEAMPVVVGEKYAANCWFHQRDLTKGIELGC